MFEDVTIQLRHCIIMYELKVITHDTIKQLYHRSVIP